jgi:hypothetical protein
VEIRSYRAVFDLERRVYRIDRLRLNPGGVPVRGIVYLLALLATVLALGRLPPTALALGTLPWYVAYLALPGAGAALLTVLRIDGRPAHLAGRALLGHWLGPRRTVGLHAGAKVGGERRGTCWRPPEILLLPDGSEARLRRLRYTGPGAVLVAVAHERRQPGGLARGLVPGRLVLRLQAAAGPRAARPGQVIALAARARVRIG